MDPSDSSLKADDSSSMMLERNDDATSTLPPGQLSARAFELADLTGIGKIYNQLKKEQDAARRSPAPAKSIEELQRTVRIIYLHDKLNQYFQTANLEIDSTIAKLNSGMSALGDRKATLADERARILRRNTFINLISGGLTKIGGYSVALTPASLIPTNVLEIFDGGVQASLSASTIKQQRDEKRFSKTTPEMLLAFINGNSQTSPQYPASVWAYLNAKANINDKVSRRVTLIERWRASGRMAPGGSTARKRPVSTAGATSKVVSFDDLDDTVTMLADIRAVLAGAQVSLMELSETLKSVYDDDPVI
ncbi:MAG: hypothetical protein HYX67_14280 [Candidatus Melainabacteria bacterium]|nr:hypothetical protein [Candidatus Melainabacteria bacterium]